MLEPSRFISRLEFRDGNPNTKTAISPALRTAIDNVLELRGAIPVEGKPITDELLSRLERTIISLLEGSTNPYHNAAHTREVMRRAEVLSRAAGLPESDINLMKLAALCHDFGHPGNTYRQLVAGVDRPDLSNEEYAALKADEFLGGQLTIYQRIVLQGLILATSFGQSNRQTLPLGQADVLYRPYEPTTQAEKLLSFADIGNCMVGWTAFVSDNLALLREAAPSKRPSSFEDWVKNLGGFTNFVEGRLKNIADIVDVSGWSETLAEIKANLSLDEADGINRFRLDFESIRAER